MSNSERYAGFNFTSSKLQAVEVTIADNQVELINVDEVYLNEEINFEKDKISKIGALLQSAFLELQINSKLNPKYISFCLPFELFSIAHLPFDNRLSGQELIEDFRLQFSVLFPFLENEFTIKYFEVEPGLFSKSNSAIIFGIERKYLELIDDFANNNNLKLLFVDNPHTAANISILSSNSILCKGYYLNIYIHKKVISYSLSYNQKVLLMKSFYFNRIGDIPEILNKELNESIFSKINSDSLIASFIAGEEVSSNLVSLLRKSLNIDFILFNPFDKIKLNSKLLENKLYLKKYNSFASALGISLRLN